MLYEINQCVLERNVMPFEKECMERVNSYQELFYYFPKKGVLV